MHIVIVIAYPLVNTIGMRRVMKYAKYLTYTKGWEVRIVGQDIFDDLQDTHRPIAYEIPFDRVYSVPIRNESRNFSFGSKYPSIGWISSAVEVIESIHQKHKIDCILTSSLPISSAIVGAILRRKHSIPWIAEFRDLWSLNDTRMSKLFVVRIIERAFERLILLQSSLLVTISPPLADQLKQLHKKRVDVIYNGFDPEDYANNIFLLENFTITYTGSIYGKRYAAPLFEALALLILEDYIFPKNFLIRFVGRARNVISEMNQVEAKYGVSLKTYVIFIDDVDYNTSIRMQQESTVLLFLDWCDDTVSGWLSGKIFEYLGSNRPILSIGLSKKHTYPILQAANCGIMLYDPLEIAEWLKESFSIYRENPNLGYTFSRQEIDKYTRNSQSERLYEIIKEIA